MKDITIDGLKDIQRAAKEFLSQVGEARHIAFYAAMGSGKTTFITALCRELGVEDLVTSPTFTIVNEYRDRNGNDVYHFDFYRINKSEELYDIGLDEYLDSGNLCLFEWPELADALLPEDTRKFRISIDGNSRRIISEI